MKQDDALATAIAWLSSLTFTRPFTLDDARALHTHIHSLRWIAPVQVDVHCPTGDLVHVRIDFDGETTRLEYTVV